MSSHTPNPQSYNDKCYPQYRMRELGVVAAVLICWISLLSGAAATGLPTGVCSGRFCGPDQSALWQRFRHGRGLEPAAIPAVYSGICFVNSAQLHPHRAHHVGLYLDEHRQGTKLGVRFTFYASAQPYAGMDLEEARERLSSPLLDVDIHDSYAYAQVRGGFEPFRYWLRRDPESSGLLMVSYFGFLQTMLCELESVSPIGAQ